MRQGKLIPDLRDKPASTPAYRVGEWEVHSTACRLVRDGRETKLTHKSMSVLDYLASRPGQAATHEELLATVWQGRISSPNAVHKSITELRHALGNGGGESEYIETIPKRGYRLVAPVSPLPDPGKPVANLPKTIAVLRFRYTDGDPGHAYLAEGVAGALLECLSQTPELAVVDRDRSFQHALGSDAPPEIGRALGAACVLDGSVSYVDDRLRISVALHRSRDGEVLYTYGADEPIADILLIQDRVIANVLAALEIHLDAQRANDLEKWGTRSVDAYLAVLEAVSSFRRLDQRSMQFAATRTRAAIALDPGFAKAYVFLAGVLETLSTYTYETTMRRAMREEVAQIREAVAKLDGQAEALDAIRRSEMRMTRPLADIEEATRATILREGAPHRACDAYVEYANVLRLARLFREAGQYLDLYSRFDPDNPGVNLFRLEMATVTLSPRRAIPLVRKTLALSQNHIAMLTTLISHLALIGEYDEAESYLRRLEEVDQSTFWSYATWLQLCALRGDWRAGSDELHAVLANPRANRFTRGIVHLILGDVAAGVEVWRQELYDPEGRGAPALLYAMYTEKYFPAAVVEDSRYQDFLDEAGIGRQWTAFLRDRLAELAPLTGIEPGDSAPQRVWSR